MDEKYVVSLRNVAIYHADSVFGRGSEEKLMRQGEMVLSEVNLNVAPGEFVYLIGRVGSGKSSLLKTLYAEVPLLTGEGRIAGFDLRRLKRRQIPYLRRRIGIVFQDYQLLTDRNVFMNLYYVLKATGWKSESQIRERIDKVLGVVQLGSKSYKMPFELSGGQQRRVAFAGVLAMEPEVLVLDEPTSSLTSEEVVKLTQSLGMAYFIAMPTPPEKICRTVVRLLGILQQDSANGQQKKPEKRRDFDRERTISNYLHIIGISPHVSGYAFLKAAIEYCVENYGRRICVTTEVYPEVARVCNSTPKRVERNIRTAIDRAWFRGDIEMQHKLFGYTVNDNKGRPTNKECIAMLTDRIVMRQKYR